MDEDKTKITIEVIYALPGEQKLIAFDVSEPCTLEQGIRLSGILERYPEIDLSKNKVGLFSRLTKLDQVLRDGDRIEIYRPLIADPKEVRKKRAAEAALQKPK